MSELFSREWLDASTSILNENSELTSRLEVMDREIVITIAVSGSPNDDVAATWKAAGGVVDVADSGQVDADLTISISWDDLVALVERSVPASVLYMQGKLKTVGDMKLSLDLLSSSERAVGAQVLESLRTMSD